MNLAVGPPDRPDVFLRGPQSLSGQSSPALTDCLGQQSGDEEPLLHLHEARAASSSSSSASKKRRKQSNPVRYGNSVPSPVGGGGGSSAVQSQSGDEEANGGSDEEEEPALDLGRRRSDVRCPHCGGLFANEALLRLHVEEEHVQKLLEETIQQQQHLKSTSIDGRDHDSPKDFSLGKHHNPHHHHFQSDLHSKGRSAESDAVLDSRADFARTFPFPGGLLHQYSPDGGKMPVPLFPGHMSPFLFPVMPPSGAQVPTSSSGSSGPMALTNGGVNNGAGSTTPTGPGGIRIFNPEAYCELCNKEFCNKYFLKTHKANKHGIYSVDSLVSAPYAGAFFSSALHPPPPSPSVSTPSISGVSTAAVVTTSVIGPLPSLPPLLALPAPPVSEPSPGTPTHGTTSLGTPNLGTPNLGSTSLGMSSLGTTPRSSAINLESYCEICQKEFCNKYFLKKHKYKIHGIGEPSVSLHNSNSSSHHSMVSSSSPTNMSVITTTTAVSAMITSSAIFNGERKSTSPATSTTSGIGSSSPPSTQQIDRQLVIAEKPVFPNSSGERSQPFSSQVLEYTCDLCKSDFPNLFTLQNHRLLAHGEGGELLSPYNGGSAGGASPGSASGIDRGEAGANLSVFTPEKLREMGVINADAFCEICCKEFCNKYFLKTHKQNKHGIGGGPEGGPGSSTSSNKPLSIHSNNSNSGPGPDKMDESSHKSFEEFQNEAMFRFPGDLDLQGGTGELNCEVCNRPFSSVYLLKMHKFYTHNVPYIKEEGRSKPGSPLALLPPPPQTQPPPTSTSSTGQPAEEEGTAVSTEDSANHDLQKLQSMIRELNASVSFESICSRTPCSICHVEFENKYFLRAHMMNEHGVLPTEDGHIPFPYAPGGSSNPSTTVNTDGEGKGDSEAYCELCNKEFCSKYFLKTHRQNIHGIPMDSFPVMRKPPLPFLVPHGQQQMMDQVNAAMNNINNSISGSSSNNNNSNNSNNNNNNNNQTPKLKTNMAMIPTSSSTTIPSPVAFPTLAPDDSLAGKQSRNVTGRNYCNICNKELCNKYFMKTHMLKMHGINLESQTGESAKSSSIGSIGTIGGVTCDICQKELCSKYFLKVHKQNTHGIFDDPPKDGPPSLVMVSSGLHGGSMEHMNMNLHRELLPGEVPDTNNRYYSHYTEVCPLCDRRFKSIKWLKSHMVNDHSDVLKDNLFLNNHHLQPLLPQLAIMPGSTTQDSSEALLCLVCGQDFPDKTSLQLHLIRDHRTTSEELGLANHRHQGTTYHQHHHSSKSSSQQPLPDSSSSSAALMSMENQLAPTSTASPGSPPLSPYQRPSPSPSPGSKNLLMSAAIKRIGVMGGSRIYQCSYCAYSTRWLSNLYAHEKRHTGIHVAPEGEKRFVCRLCHRAYRYNHSLQRHMLSHHRGKSSSGLLMPQGSLTSKDGKTLVKMKRYRCSKCNRKFRTRDLCLAHIHAAHRKGNPNNNNISSNTGLNLTMSNHQQDPDSAPESVYDQDRQGTPRPSQKSGGVRPYRCRLCPFATRSWNVLKVHISKLHPELPEDLSGKEPPQSNGGLPMTYAMPQNPPTAGSFIMQPFLLAQQPPEGGDTFVPSLVYLPVCHKISQPVTVAFSLTPA